MAKMPMPYSNPSTYPNHTGVDFGQPSYKPIPAIAAGTITYRDWWGNGGNTVTITRPDGLKIMNCHMPDFAATPKIGTKVVVGQTVGRVGSTGRSTGPHLHTEFWLNGVALNEWDYMDRNNWIGKPQPPKPPAPAGEKGVTVVKKQYHVQDAQSRATKHRKVAAGGAFWLNASATAPVSNASNIVGLAGPYQFVLHVAGSGTPGDIVQVQLFWDVTTSTTHSGHYKHRAIVDADGHFAFNAPFERNVASGQKVYAQFRAGRNNRGTITMECFDSDAWLLGTA